VQEPGICDDRHQVADRSPDSHQAEGVRSLTAQGGEGHRHRQRNDRAQEDREQRSQDEDRDEPDRRCERGKADRRAGGHQRQHRAPCTRAVGDVPPERLRDDAEQWRHRQHQTRLRPVELRVLVQIEREEGEEDAEAAEGQEPEEREGEEFVDLLSC
jgi:hypothetical protein